MENKLGLESLPAFDEAYKMVLFLQELLVELKAEIIQQGFVSIQDEIDFFKIVKPEILGKLIYYNKIFRIETGCPVSSGKMYFRYYLNEFRLLKQEYKNHISNSNFYRYYRSGRTDNDDTYFRLGKINIHDGLNSFVFEVESNFSTYYDYKVARIIANEFLYSYLLSKINQKDELHHKFKNSYNSKDLLWTDSKSALVELIYALYASGVLSHGKISARKIGSVFQALFRIPINDLHHAFHRMKTRAGSRTIFLDHLKNSLEEYMDKEP
ncbi:hypothetical protein HNP37_001770 [Flavobacterium nitrogenifigens]|uniref:RteC protein n=2 Tax=Flavobacterium TaxID=237 RepID=A0A7W7N7Q3_9FLAO|nr:hypothetical protein [Flavobacterium nitrogenifigens]